MCKSTKKTRKKGECANGNARTNPVCLWSVRLDYKRQVNRKMRKFKRIFTIVIDSLGVGAMPDSVQYGDVGVNTFLHVWNASQGLDIPNLRMLGLGNLCGVATDAVRGYFLDLYEASAGKDTMTGHWEMMGLYVPKPFRTFTDTGFPPELIRELEKRCGRKIVGNKSASGTEILEEYGPLEIEQGVLIVYTSADSVLQICGNEETMGLETLYHYCEIARELTMRDEWKVGRVIARPYVGKKRGEFRRTENRRDYSLKPPGRTALDVLSEAGLDVIGVGKIHDIFSGQGLTRSLHSHSSVHGMEQTIELAKEDFHGLCFVNLVDFDALWGHRRNPVGYGRELEAFDVKLGELLGLLREDDLLMITADHGNDPTYVGTDHTRERVPLLLYAGGMKQGGRLASEDTFGVVGSTIADNFDLRMPPGSLGYSLMPAIVF